MYELGKFLRYRYNGLLSSTYKAAETSVISSHRARCIMSAQLVLAGLYPPEGIQIWNQDLPWQPIPVHSLPDSCDDILRVTKRCALLSKEFKARNIFIQKIVDNEHALLNYLSNSTGFNVKGLNDIINIYDNLKVVEEQGFPLPNWGRDDYRDKMHSLAMIGYLHLYKPPIMVRLQSGVLINEILSSMKQRSNPLNNFHRRLNMYSAQDRTLLYLWRGLNISQEIFESPPYGSAIIIELHEMKNNYRVKILLKKEGIGGDLSTLTIRGCENDPKDDGMCDLHTFSSTLQTIVITNFDEACQN